MIPKSELYQRYEVRRKAFLTRYTKSVNFIKQELLQYSLDLNNSHLDFVYEMLFNDLIDSVNCFINDFKKFK